MSFSFTAVGTVEQVRAQLEAVRERTAKYPPGPQHDLALQLVESELAEWPSTPAAADNEVGLHVEASGHHDQNQRTLSIKIRPVWFPNVKADASSSD